MPAKDKTAKVDPNDLGAEPVENDPAPCEELPTAEPAKPARVKG